MNMKYAVRCEDTEQMAAVQWATWNEYKYPELKWLHHIPNGGRRNKAEAIKLKQMGVASGVSDLCLPYPKGMYCGLYIEMKYGDNRLQKTQKEFLADMEKAGHFVATCYSAEEAIKVMEEYLCLPDTMYAGAYEEIAKITKDEYLRQGIERNMMSIPNNSIIKNGKITRGSAK